MGNLRDQPVQDHEIRIQAILTKTTHLKIKAACALADTSYVDGFPRLLDALTETLSVEELSYALR